MTTQLPAYVAILLLYVSRTSCQDTFTAAVYEHAVILPNVTLTPVSREEALALMNRNLDVLEGAITSAAQQVPSLPSLQCTGFYEKGGGPRRQGQCQGPLHY